MPDDLDAARATLEENHGHDGVHMAGSDVTMPGCPICLAKSLLAEVKAARAVLAEIRAHGDPWSSRKAKAALGEVVDDALAMYRKGGR